LDTREANIYKCKQHVTSMYYPRAVELLDDLSKQMNDGLSCPRCGYQM